MLTPFRFKIGDNVRLVTPIFDGFPVKPGHGGKVIALTMDRKGTYASVKFNNTRLLIAEGNLVLA